jgi:rhodanese-related sulfurtransferase
MNTLAADELKGMLELKETLGRDDAVTLINVMSEEEFQEAHIPGSANVPVSWEDFVERVEELAGGKDKPVVVYSATSDGGPSRDAARKLEETGFTKVYDIEGGMEAWLDAGEYVVRPDKNP